MTEISTREINENVREMTGWADRVIKKILEPSENLSYRWNPTKEKMEAIRLEKNI